MDIERYLKRISFSEKVTPDDKTLIGLHEHHVFHVPFENLDIHYKNLFDLAPERIFDKVVTHFRGGFCYELNSIFHTLLVQLGFNSTIISARIIDDSGGLGPEFDHMVICIETNTKKYLADVGYGDLFIKPLEIKEGIQSDGRNHFKIDKLHGQEFVLSMSSDQEIFHDKYRFSLLEVPVDKFTAICLEKQTSPSSYFVKNIVCTKPTTEGRITLFNDKLIERKNQERTEKFIRDEDELVATLKNNFGVVIG